MLASESWLVLLVSTAGSELVIDSVSLFCKTEQRKIQQKYTSLLYGYKDLFITVTILSMTQQQHKMNNHGKGNGLSLNIVKK